MSGVLRSHAQPQEREYRGYRFFWPGSQQVQNIAPPVPHVILGRQEQPWHPRPLLFSAPPPVPLVIQRPFGLFVRQEQPDHPKPRLFPGNPALSYEDCQFFVII